MYINNGHGWIKKSFKTGMFKAALFCPGHSWYSGGDGPEQPRSERRTALMPEYADRPVRSMLWQIQRDCQSRLPVSMQLFESPCIWTGTIIY